MKVGISQNNLKESYSTHRDLHVGIRNAQNGAHIQEIRNLKNQFTPRANAHAHR